MRHQLANLPEIAEAAALEVARRDLDNQARDARIVVDDLIAEQEKIDADVDAVRARRERDRDRMDRGLISNPKDLERMTHEMASLERRISSLEDDELEVMERVEEAQTASDSLASRIAATDIRLADLAAARAEKTREIEAELTSLTDRRGPLAADLPGDLVALYDRLRAAKAGIGAALLRARECGGCRLSLDAAELTAIRAAAADEVIRCEQCQRILVRTDESGV